MATPRNRPVWALMALAGVAVAASLLLVLSASGKSARADASGDPGKIAFHSHGDIFTMNPDGSGAVQLPGPGADYFPAFSADGKRITFISQPAGSPVEYDTELYVMNADGSDQTRLTNNVANESHPTFSPDGKKILFVSDRDGNKEIYSMNADGSGTRTNLTNNPADDTEPAVSPDGKKIAFATVRDDPGAFYEEIYVMAADGSGQRNLTNTPSEWDTSPEFSADGTKIAFDAGSDIYAMDADGSDRTNLTNTNDSFTGSPSFSTDGTRMAFHKLTYFFDREGPLIDIYATNADGSGGQTQLTHDTYIASTGWPDWQPNSAPAVEPLRPAPGSSTADRTPRVSAKVSDLQEDLTKADVTKLSIDGRVVRRAAFAYDPATDRLSYTPPAPLSYGRHTVRVEAEDSVGAAMVKAWSFRVAKRR